MSLKKNVLASYISQFYVTIIGIVMVPLYLKHMGAEAYGLVGFFAMLQAWFNLLDMGLSPTMSREVARYRGGAINLLQLRNLLRTLEAIFIVVAIAGCVAIVSSSGFIAAKWLNVDKLPLEDVQNSIIIMAIIAALRWVASLYRSVVSGFEQFVWLSKFNIAIGTAHSVLVIPFFIYVGSSPLHYFGYQLAVTAITLIAVVLKSYQLLPSDSKSERASYSWVSLRGVLKFSLSITFTSSVWVLVTQTDKLVLSNLLPLAEYGYFSLAVLVANGVLIICGPISGAIMPRMAKLEAEKTFEDLIKLYRNATQVVVITAGAVSITLALWAEQLLMAWTGDTVLALKAAPVLALYSIGNGILAVSAFPYYLQYAKGNLRLHLIGNAIFVIALIPSIIWAASKFGAIGAGIVWMTMNFIAFAAWLPIVHRKFVPGLNFNWYLKDILPIASIMAIGGVGLKWAFPHSGENIVQLVVIGGFGLLILLLGAVSSSTVREYAFLRRNLYRK